MSEVKALMISASINHLKDWVNEKNPLLQIHDVQVVLNYLDKLEKSAKSGRELHDGLKALTGKHVTAANMRIGVNMLCDAYDADTLTKGST